MHQALYRKWRPRDFDSVCGQEHITSVLKYEVANNRYSHAYLFCGSRGTGKTTCAKLLAKALNCESPVNGSPCGKCDSCKAIDSETATDVVEMDAASNTGVDYIRDIRETVMYAPTMVKNRVYIIDEVHMLTQSAFNALLKTLEEPPSQVVFILATTEQQKIPATILSRCQKFEFRRIASDVIADRLMYIAGEENISITREAAKLIAKTAQGGMRDAISLMELCAGEGKEITLPDVRAVTGSLGREHAVKAVKAVLSKDADAIFSITGDVVSSAKEITVFWQELLDLYRDLLVFKTTKNPESYLDLTSDERDALKELSDSCTLSTLIRHSTLVENAFGDMQRQGASKRLCAEMALLKMSDERLDTLPEGIVARLSALEEKIAAIQNGIQLTPNIPETVKAEASESAMFKKTAPPAPVAEAKLPEAPPAPTREKMKAVNWWIEAAKKIGEKNPAAYPFLKLSRAYEAGDKISVRVEGEIGMMMLDTPEIKAMLSNISAMVGDRAYPPSAFEFIAVAVEHTEINPLDDFSSEE